MAIDLEYIRCSGPGVRFKYTFDDLTGDLVYLGSGDPSDPPIYEGDCYELGETLYTGANWRVIVDNWPGDPSIQPGGGVSTGAYLQEVFDCSTVIDSVTSTPDLDNGNTGKITIAAHCDTTVEYALFPGGVTTDDWQVSGLFENLPAGTYYAYAREIGNTDCAPVSQMIVVSAAASLQATISGTNSTAPGQNDGYLQVQVQAAGLSGSIAYITAQPDWEVAEIHANGTLPLWIFTRGSLAPDTYTVLLTDDITGQTLSLSIVITEPTLPPVDPPDPVEETVGDFLFVPNMNPLNFVRRTTIDNCNVLQTLDNTLFCEQLFPGYKEAHYYNPIAKCDVLTFQFQSNYMDTLHSIKIKDLYTGATVKQYYPTLKEQNIGRQETYDITITNNGGTQSRVTFNVGDIPLPIEIGMDFQIQNNADGFDGVYTIVEIQTDELLGTQYIVINKEYTIGTPSTNAEGVFVTDLVEFNVFEFLVNNLIDLSDGEYYFEIIASSDEATIQYESEPFQLAVEHEDTNLIEYRNFDNAFDMTWTTGIVCKIRVPSTFFKRLPGGIRETSRNSDESLQKLMAKKHRVVLFEFWDIPPYLVEKLSVLFDCDSILINGVAYQTDEGLSEPKYKEYGYRLANCSINVEQVEWFQKGNSDDLGNVDIDPGGHIVVNGGFLLR